MLTPKEQQLLERQMKLRERQIVTDDEVAGVLAWIARRGKLDALLAAIPPDLVGPLTRRVAAGPAEQADRPDFLPEVTAVDVVAIDPDRDVNRMHDLIRVAAGPSMKLVGDPARAIAALWRDLPPGEQARCHIPPYGLRFHRGDALICEASICWECNNIFGWVGDKELAYQFDAEAPTSLELLAAIRRAVGESAGV